MMFLPILVCLLITAFPLGYAAYRTWKLAELERIARSWDGMRLGRLAESIDLDRSLLPVDDDPLGLRQIDCNRSATFPQLDEATQAGLDALSQAIAASKVTLVPIDPYVPRDIYYDVARGQYREVKHGPPPPDAVPFYRVGYAEPASWRDSEGNKYEPPDYEVAQLKYPEWKPGE